MESLPGGVLGENPDGLEEASPLYDANADVVLVGVGHNYNNTSLHVAEARALGENAPIVTTGRRC